MRFDPSPATMGTSPQPVSLRIRAAQLKGSEGRKVGTSLRMTWSTLTAALTAGGKCRLRGCAGTAYWGGAAAGLNRLCICSWSDSIWLLSCAAWASCPAFSTFRTATAVWIRCCRSCCWSAASF